MFFFISNSFLEKIVLYILRCYKVLTRFLIMYKTVIFFGLIFILKKNCVRVLFLISHIKTFVLLKIFTFDSLKPHFYIFYQIYKTNINQICVNTKKKKIKEKNTQKMYATEQYNCASIQSIHNSCYEHIYFIK